MGVIIAAILLGLIPAFIAKKKGRSFGLWWFYGAMLFIIALIHSLLMKPNPQGIEQIQRSEGLKKCAYCAEFVKVEASVCKHCGRDIVAVA
jgi:hypothetical protein